ncbi:TetR/AcrR family transcriptional regulator [Antrihabitans spumae]|uniref:TetR/AcrR family transcriptional regulator n=1 Tax=Antrihabitans spumae TaxID=3373370 RepID=A0ABW7JSA2_9NOCA
MGRRSDAREKMLLSAVALFRRHGIDGTAIGDVIADAAAPRGSIYHHFPGGKAQLAEEATRMAGAAVTAAVAHQLAADSPEATLAFLIDTFRKELLDSDFTSGCPIGAAALEGGGMPAARTAAGESFAMWESMVAAALWQRGLPLERAEALATTVIAALEGAIMLSKAQRSTRALDRIEAVLSALLLDRM